MKKIEHEKEVKKEEKKKSQEAYLAKIEKKE